VSDPTSSDPDKAAERPGRLGGNRAWRHADFRWFWFTRVFGQLAIDAQITAVGWQVYRLTGSELNLGLVGLAQFAPVALLFILTGIAADNLPRARIVLGCVSLQATAALMLFGITVTGIENFSLILAILVVLGIARAFQLPAQQAIVPNLVPAADVSNAIAWAATGSQMARVSGPTIAGLLIGFGGAGEANEVIVYALVASLLVTATICATLIRSPVQVMSREPITIANMFAGLRFILSRQVIFGAIALDLFAVLFGGVLALLPVYAKDILQVGPEGFGVLRSTFTAGAFTGALTMTQFPIRRHAGIKLLSTVGIFGLGVITFGLSELFWLSIGALYVMGLADSMSVFVRQNLVQIITPDEMRGRVSAVASLFINASNELGEFESGITAHWWGTVPAVVFGGSVTFGVAVLFAVTLPKLRGVDRLDAEDLVRRYRDLPAKEPPPQ
jgi:MFS family permease